ncbi:hypothetical protein [Marivirga arenosa]|uniref:Uncharacterized protein n=1 Tax=Marivirga arenosa TaxID=3059076 RepID=A0AA51X4T3_9BACT|nr:hypothetical protein [Marivirga sp. BKB1-2]WNB17041.1 hypothetical protein QYS47_32700 [Marivirga sp. BKB1-2]
MEENQEQIAQQWHAFLQEYFQKRIQQKQEFILKHFEFIKEQKPSDSKISDAKIEDDYKQSVFEFIKNTYNVKPNLEAEDEINVHQTLSTEFHNYLSSIPEKVNIEQREARFKILKEDAFRLKLLKPYKIFAFKFSKIPFHIANLFRKEKKKLHYWKHEVKTQALFERWFFNKMYSTLDEVNQDILKEFSDALLEVKSFESNPDQIDNDPTSYFNEDFKKSIKLKINDAYLKNCEQYEKEFELIGTIEYNKKLISERRLERDYRQLKKHYSKHHHNWQNTIHALFEDWRSVLELSALQAYIANNIHDLDENIQSWKAKIYDHFLNDIKSYLAEAQAMFDQEVMGLEGITKKITQVKYITNKKLGKGLIQNMQENLSKNSILNQMDRLEHMVSERVEKLATAYVVTKSNQFDVPLEDNELSTISNYELLSFELIPDLNAKLEELKSEVFRVMDELLIKVGDIDEIVDYVLSAASNSLDQDEDEQQAKSIIVDGFERAENTTNEVESQINEIVEKSGEQLREMSDELIEELQKLKQNDKVSALRIRISKAKALHKSEALTQKVFDYIKNYFSIAKSFFLKYYDKALELKTELSKRFLSATIVNEPNRAVSDFLNESNQIINGLPLIYRKLYAIEPLTDMVLFEGREKEIKRISTAYAAWQEGKFAAVLLTAEKWSGMTSLINYSVKNIKFNIIPLRIELKINDPEPQTLFKILSEKLEENLTDKESIIEFLNTGKKRIIIIENLQKLFLREMHGQKSLIDFIDIMTATQKNVFWIGSISIYTFNYLEKSLKMSAFFSYHIPLEPLSDDEISKLIIKRNRISGFKIQFEKSEKDINDKKYNKLDEKEKQDHLKERFFKDLNNFAKSNISMALMFWLLSTKKVDDQNIIIKNFKKPDFSFLSSIKMDRVFVLQALIMHDGLFQGQLAKVLSYDITKTKFLLIELLEDGVLQEKEGQFFVNPIIYRNTVQLLKSRNLL